jgi:hypothetical protein
MKILCPNCQREYKVPQELIDEILAAHRPKPLSPQEQFLQGLAVEPESAEPVLGHKAFVEFKRRGTDSFALAVLAMGGLFVAAVFAANVWHNFAYPQETLNSSEGLRRVAIATLFAIVTLSFYLAPTAVAFFRAHPNAGAIAAVNVLLGWTFIGYVLALVWSLAAISDSVRATVVSRFR